MVSRYTMKNRKLLTTTSKKIFNGKEYTWVCNGRSRQELLGEQAHYKRNAYNAIILKISGRIEYKYALYIRKKLNTQVYNYGKNLGDRKYLNNRKQGKIHIRHKDYDTALSRKIKKGLIEDKYGTTPKEIVFGYQKEKYINKE